MRDAARRLFRAGVLRPPRGPAGCLGWPRRCLKGAGSEAPADADLPDQTRTWEPSLEPVSLRACSEHGYFYSWTGTLEARHFFISHRQINIIMEVIDVF